MELCHRNFIKKVNNSRTKEKSIIFAGVKKFLNLKLKKMKRAFLAVILVCAFTSLQAQYFVSGSLGAWNQKINDVKYSTFSFYPGVGMGFGENLHAGITIGLDRKGIAGNNISSDITFISYVGYTFYQGDIVGAFVDAAFVYSTDKSFSIGLSPAIIVPLSDKISMVSSIGFLGYENYGSKSNSWFGLDFDPGTVRFGLIYTF